MPNGQLVRSNSVRDNQKNFSGHPEIVNVQWSLYCAPISIEAIFVRLVRLIFLRNDSRCQIVALPSHDFGSSVCEAPDFKS